MSLSEKRRQLVHDENGSFTSTAIFLIILMTIIGIAVIDGSSVFYAYRSANDVTEQASELAMEEHRLNRNVFRAEQVAIEHCEEKGLTFIEIRRLPELSSDAYEVTCEAHAETFVFKHLPWFRDLTVQRTANTEYRSV